LLLLFLTKVQRKQRHYQRGMRQTISKELRSSVK
ncbi:archaeal/vacuolar-type H+-ATPase subunit B, partial [Vibrio harveyi]